MSGQGPLDGTWAVIGTDLEATIDGNLAMAASSFRLPSAAVTAVIGPNGSGKSTLLNLVAGLLRPTAGSLEVSGRADGGSPAQIAYVLQATNVNDTLPISVREVVTMGRYASRGMVGRMTAVDRAAVQSALKALGIADLARRSLHELSGGQRQRVFVAQGLAQDHRLLLLDEPLMGLDLVSSAAIERIITDERSAGRTVVLTTHDVSQALAADWAVLMAGQVIASGPPGEALSPANLALAYGIKVVQDADGRFVVDDPAHAPVAGTGRHVHLDRSLHLEVPGSGLHRD
ncbi:MAG TPA: metal ABC transporter ATP-binding protein [Acidimicrobiia bacterium]|nr:metal ABC transporter ATP-binding protein [Acidimicrobiia bacterium]